MSGRLQFDREPPRAASARADTVMPQRPGRRHRQTLPRARACVPGGGAGDRSRWKAVCCKAELEHRSHRLAEQPAARNSVLKAGAEGRRRRWLLRRCFTSTHRGGTWGDQRGANPYSSWVHLLAANPPLLCWRRHLAAAAGAAAEHPSGRFVPGSSAHTRSHAWLKARKRNTPEPAGSLA